jgi:hypothetical protein
MRRRKWRGRAGQYFGAAGGAQSWRSAARRRYCASVRCTFLNSRQAHAGARSAQTNSGQRQPAVLTTSSRSWAVRTRLRLFCRMPSRRRTANASPRLPRSLRKRSSSRSSNLTWIRREPSWMASGVSAARMSTSASRPARRRSRYTRNGSRTLSGHAMRSRARWPKSVKAVEHAYVWTKGLRSEVAVCQLVWNL